MRPHVLAVPVLELGTSVPTALPDAAGMGQSIPPTSHPWWLH